jgi:hypothetical protein
MSPPTRRIILGMAAAAPFVAALGHLAGTARRHASAIRPTATGTSRSRCATCGSTAHAMLACPANRLEV